ncbi:MAG: restriction endonuclease subunit S [Gammaproteobacteria bacterium]|nr:restriction endonuclease subunit S [Gammaproteobacteria bacterium]
MAVEWTHTSLREAGVTLIDCDHRTPPAADSGYPYVAIPQLKEGRLELTDVRLISPNHFIEWTRKAKPQHHDVILSRRCNPGETAHVPAGLQCALGQNLVLLRADGSKLFPPFLRWLVRGPHWWGQVGTFINVGAVFDSLKCADIPNFKMPLPPLPEQKAIAAVLGALDDKIELNRQVNATLEAMARALFQSWFVDFDPVRAKLDGRQPHGLDPATAALFPASFQGSQAGHIPSGWATKPVGEVVDCVGGGTPSTAEPKYWEGGTHHWTTPKDFSSLQAPILLDTNRKLTDVGIAKISSGLLPAGTLLLSSRAPVGYLAIAAMPVAINQGFIALRCNERASNFFMLNWCQMNMADIESRATGTTFAEISKQNFRPIRVVLPPKELMGVFTEGVAPLYAQITANLQQSRTLATLRDTLLPKLLSGELSVRSASAAVDAAA